MTDSIKVHIQNFQSIADLQFEISGFTCITGKTNIGKSAIIRAISGALLNIPVVSLVRQGEKYTTVELQSSDWGLKWEKAERGVNRYWLPGKEKPLDKVGAGQTDFIQDIGFQAIKIGSDVIHPWHARQFFPLFLVDRSGPAVTDFISEVSRLKVLQSGILINVRNRKRALDEAKIYEKNVEKLKAKDGKLDKLDDLLELESDLDSQFESIEEYSERILAIEEFMSKIEVLSNQIQKLNQIELVKIPSPIKQYKIDRLQNMLKVWIKLQNIAKRIIRLKPIEDVQISKIEDLENIQKISKGIRILNQFQSAQKRVDLLSVEITIPGSEECTEKLSNGKGYLRRLNQLKDEERALSSQRDTIQSELDKVQEELDRIPLCPTCKMPSIRPLPCPDHQT